MKLNFISRHFYTYLLTFNFARDWIERGVISEIAKGTAMFKLTWLRVQHMKAILIQTRLDVGTESAKLWRRTFHLHEAAFSKSISHFFNIALWNFYLPYIYMSNYGRLFQDSCNYINAPLSTATTKKSNEIEKEFFVGCTKQIDGINPISESVFIYHSQQHSLSFSPRFCKLESNTISDWLSHTVYIVWKTGTLYIKFKHI